MFLDAIEACCRAGTPVMGLLECGFECVAWDEAVGQGQAKTVLSLCCEGH